MSSLLSLNRLGGLAFVTLHLYVLRTLFNLLDATKYR